MKMTIVSRIAAITFVLLAGAASRATAQQKLEELADQPGLFLEVARKQLKWDEEVEPAKLVGPIYFVGTKGLSAYLITSSEGLIVVNTGMPGSGQMIEKSIRKLGFKPEDIKLLLTAHAHVDHVGGHAYLKTLSGGKIAMIEQEKDLFESGGKLDFHYGKIKEFQFEPAKVDQVFKDGETLTLGDVAITAIHTPGHTKGSTTFAMKVVDDIGEGKPTYSVVFPNGASVNPGYRVVKDPSYPGIADDYRRSLQVFESLKPDIWLTPHTESFGYDAKLAAAKKLGAKAWVDPDGYKKWAEGVRAKFTAAIEKETTAKNPLK